MEIELWNSNIKIKAVAIILTIRVEESISFECKVRFLKFFFLFISTITVKPIPPKIMREEITRLTRMLWECDIKLSLHTENPALLKAEIE